MMPKRNKPIRTFGIPGPKPPTRKFGSKRWKKIPGTRTSEELQRMREKILQNVPDSIAGMKIKDILRIMPFLKEETGFGTEGIVKQKNISLEELFERIDKEGTLGTKNAERLLIKYGVGSIVLTAKKLELAKIETYQDLIKALGIIEEATLKHGNQLPNFWIELKKIVQKKGNWQIVERAIKEAKRLHSTE